MTIEEVSCRYQIPERILKDYERLSGSGLVKKAAKGLQYDDQDLERLSLMMTLHDIGFKKEEVEEYMVLASQEADTGDERLRILQKKRNGILDEIHFQEKKLEYLDYLRYEIKHRK